MADGRQGGRGGQGGPDFARLGDLLPEHTQGAARGPRGAAPGRAAAPQGPQGADDLGRRLAAVWADTVGPEVAANARPAQLRDGRLVVTTSSSAWAQSLQLMSPMVIARLNERLGDGVVKKAVFRHAGWDPFAPGGPESAPLGGAAAAGGAGGAGAARAEGAPLLPGESAPPAGGSSPRTARGGRGGRRAAPATPRSLPVSEQPAAPPWISDEAPSPALQPFPAPPANPAGPGSEPTPVSAGATAAPPSPPPVEGLTREEQDALAELDRQPLDPVMKARIRDAMLAGFVRARQDSGRS